MYKKHSKETLNGLLLKRGKGEKTHQILNPNQNLPFFDQVIDKKKYRTLKKTFL